MCSDTYFVDYIFADKDLIYQVQWENSEKSNDWDKCGMIFGIMVNLL